MRAYFTVFPKQPAVCDQDGPPSQDSKLKRGCRLARNGDFARDKPPPPHCPSGRRSIQNAEKTHEANERAGRHLKEAFGDRSIREISADDIELYLRRRLQARVQIKTRAGVVQRDRLKPATVH
jgi:hypothetical protein